ncbi:unnamed protein product [Prorocentrum cordatum]|uniref:Uncharacterized protein n=1 Tax=Prorocentrum cordatum TaxID=2364126 RepID=A0ABN9TL77_9DINO|nr:unnamed protein product [Polarella glacialis]
MGRRCPRGPCGWSGALSAGRAETSSTTSNERPQTGQEGPERPPTCNPGAMAGWAAAGQYIEENSLPSCSKAGKIARGRANKLVVEEPRERSLHVIIRAFKHSSAEAQSPRGKRAKLEHLLAMACCRRAPAAARPAGRGRVGGGPGRETERCRHQPCERRNVWVASRGGREASIARVGGGLWLAGGAREVGGGDGGGPPNKTGGLLNRTKPHSEPRSRPLRETLGEDPRKGAVSIEPLPRSGRASCLKVF